MKTRPKIWLRCAVLVTMLALAVLAAAFPVVFSSTVLESFLRILEVVARLS